jgi:hypothetical protein
MTQDDLGVTSQDMFEGVSFSNVKRKLITNVMFAIKRLRMDISSGVINALIIESQNTKLMGCMTQQKFLFYVSASSM